jgi:hypothetical protein
MPEANMGTRKGKIHLISKFNSKRQAFLAAMILILLGGLSTMMAAQADGPGVPQVTSQTNTTAAANNAIWTQYQCRQNYWLRYPRAKWAHDLDLTQKTTSKGPSAGSDNTVDQDPIPDKSGTDANEPNANAPNNSTINALQSVGGDAATISFPAMTYVAPTYLDGYYTQPEEISIATLPSMRDTEITSMPMKTFGYPLSDTQFQVIDRENKQRFLELLFDPERWLWIGNMWARISQGSVGNSLANTAQSGFTNATNQIMQPEGPGTGTGSNGVGNLPNIANEATAAGGIANVNSGSKNLNDVIAMVQLLYKQLFVPMAILFLLPGAVITQIKAQITQAFSLQSDEAGSPFEGILRAMIALFLIPATQLIMSYAIDIGNSLTYSVANYVQTDMILGWANSLAYAPPPNMFLNAIIPPGSSTSGSGGILSSLGSGGQSGLTQDFSDLGGVFASGNLSGIVNAIVSLFGTTTPFTSGGNGLGDDQPAAQVHIEQQSWESQMLQLVFNVATTMFSNLMIVGTMFQLVFMCYLLLLGPLAAAFYAWPKIGQNLFKDIFMNWVNAVIQLSLWRFVWVTLLAVMTQRLLYIQRTGAPMNLQWEIAVFACFIGLMFYIPTAMWNFDPGQAFTASAALGSSSLGNGQLSQQMQKAGFSPQQIQQAQDVLNEMQKIGVQNYDADMGAHPGAAADHGQLPGMYGAPGAQGSNPTGAGQQPAATPGSQQRSDAASPVQGVTEPPTNAAPLVAASAESPKTPGETEAPPPAYLAQQPPTAGAGYQLGNSAVGASPQSVAYIPPTNRPLSPADQSNSAGSDTPLLANAIPNSSVPGSPAVATAFNLAQQPPQQSAQQKGGNDIGQQIADMNSSPPMPA